MLRDPVRMEFDINVGCKAASPPSLIDRNASTDVSPDVVTLADHAHRVCDVTRNVE
jgi:hypothetical protein